MAAARFSGTVAFCPGWAAFIADEHVHQAQRSWGQVSCGEQSRWSYTAKKVKRHNHPFGSGGQLYALLTCLLVTLVTIMQSL
jgi:hypothetical protein